MSITTDTTPAEQLLALVADSDVLTDNQKEMYIAELTEGRIHPELEAKLDEICDRQTIVSTADIQSLTAEIAAQDFLKHKAQAEDDAESSQLVATHEKDVTAAIADHKVASVRIERDLDRDVQGMIETQKEQPEADAIRTMLKQKPDGSA